MALLTVQTPLPTGATPTLSAASGGGDTVPPGDNVWIQVNNGSGGSITVTVVCKTACSYGAGTPTHDLSVSVPAAGVRNIGPIGAARFADPANNGLASITYSAVTSLTVGAFSV